MGRAESSELPDPPPRGPGGINPTARTWDTDEDEILESAINKYGCRWKAVASCLVGRTEAMCRNRWQRKQAPLKPGYNGSKNKCTVCGEVKRGHTCLGAKRPLAGETEMGGGRALASFPDTLQPPSEIELPTCDVDSGYAELFDLLTDYGDEDTEVSSGGGIAPHVLPLVGGVVDEKAGALGEMGASPAPSTSGSAEVDGWPSTSTAPLPMTPSLSFSATPPPPPSLMPSHSFIAEDLFPDRGAAFRSDMLRTDAQPNAKQLTKLSEPAFDDFMNAVTEERPPSPPPRVSSLASTANPFEGLGLEDDASKPITI